MLALFVKFYIIYFKCSKYTLILLDLPYIIRLLNVKFEGLLFIVKFLASSYLHFHNTIFDVVIITSVTIN